eukprot:TRINITY_DN780051_c0_g1_i1.p1 TRINITY_DN780051_c0_g1~~TRINITY_DN780051_c0_g1_i1.p1  ORF type:complete len:148 (-),score=15.34 TRINITY_DN780051_c0_g1_i1:121-564(-)
MPCKHCVAFAVGRPGNAFLADLPLGHSEGRHEKFIEDLFEMRRNGGNLDSYFLRISPKRNKLGLFASNCGQKDFSEFPCDERPFLTTPLSAYVLILSCCFERVRTDRLTYERVWEMATIAARDRKFPFGVVADPVESDTDTDTDSDE